MEGRFTRAELGLVGTAAALVFTRVFGLSVVLPNFRSHYEGAGFDPLWIGLAFGGYGLTMAAMQLPWGVLSDKWSRRGVLLTATLLFVAGSVAASQATSQETLFAARLLQGLGAVASVAVAAVGETVHAGRRTTAMALVGIPAGAGFLVGVGTGSALYPAMGMEGLFLLTAAMGLVAALPLARVRIAPRHERPAAVMKPNARALALAMIGFASSYMLSTMLFFLPDSDWRALLPALLLALIVVGWFSRAADRHGWTWRPAMFAMIIMAGAAVPWYDQGTGIAATALAGVFFAGHAVLSTALPSQVSKLSGPAGGRGHGVQNIFAYSGTFVGGAVAGALTSSPFTALTVALSVCVLSASGGAFVFLLHQHTAREDPKPS